MRIGIDGRVFIGNKTGLGQYVTELCKALDVILPKAEFHIYNRDYVELPVKNDRWHLHIEENIFRKKFKNILWQKFVSGKLCQRDKIDVYWGAGSFIPFFMGTTKTVLTVYDLVYKVNPDTMYRFNLWVNRLFFARDVENTTKITTISKGTSKRLNDLFGCCTDAIVYPSFDKGSFHAEINDLLHCHKKYNITHPFFLSVATWEPRKNLQLLIDTFLEMKKERELPDFQLVLSGGRGWKDEKFSTLLQHKEYREWILPLGYIPREDLYLLYSSTQAFIFPSLYEGFGMPVLEAREFGIPVITSNTPELREAGGDGCIYIEPTFQGIRRGILQSVEMNNQPSSNSVRHPSWQDGAEKMAKIFKYALEGK